MLELNEYLKFPISKEIRNGLLNITVNIVKKIINWIEKIINLYIILIYIAHFWSLKIFLSQMKIVQRFFYNFL